MSAPRPSSVGGHQDVQPAPCTRILLLLPDGPAVRSFLLSDVISHLAPRTGGHPPVVFSPGADHAHPSLEVDHRPLPDVDEGRWSELLRSARARADRSPYRKRTRPSRLLARARSALAAAIGGVAAVVPGGRQGLARVHEAVVARSAAAAAWTDVLLEVQPDVVFCGHQRAGRAVAGMVAARRLGIPTATFVYSWDNVPKGEFAFTAERYLVWSDRMAAQLLGRYPWITEDQVTVVGTPQFEPHLDEGALQARADFSRSIGLDPGRPIVLFSGDDVTTSPHDPRYLDDVATAIEQDPRLSRVQLVFRRCPADLSARYDEVLTRHPWVVVAEPEWSRPEGGGWNDAVPTPADQGMLSNLVEHSAVTVNIGSTVAMDFAIKDKPAIWPAYEQDGGGSWDCATLYSRPHFASVHEWQPVHWARSRRDLADALATCLGDDGKRVARARWVDDEVRGPLTEASSRVASAIVELGRR